MISLDLLLLTFYRVCQNRQDLPKILTILMQAQRCQKQWRWENVFNLCPLDGRVEFVSSRRRRPRGFKRRYRLWRSRLICSDLNHLSGAGVFYVRKLIMSLHVKFMKPWSCIPRTLCCFFGCRGRYERRYIHVSYMFYQTLSISRKFY
jgi:hypothetical protein